MGLRQLSPQFTAGAESSFAARQMRAGHERFKARLRAARFETDRLFSLLRGDALSESPVAGLQPLIFYLGHLEAFDWTLLGRDTLGLRSFDPKLDELFALRAEGGQSTTHAESSWPSVAAIRSYSRRARASLDQALDSDAFGARLAHAGSGHQGSMEMALEHRLLHAEIIASLIHRLPHTSKKSGPLPAPTPDPSASRFIEVHAGVARLGLGPSPTRFAWDHEQGLAVVNVPAFAISSTKVTNAEFLRFVQEGGYQQRSFWSPDDWAWLQTSGIRQPAFWAESDDQWKSRTMFGEVPLCRAWPVYVSKAEAEAYARWSGSRLPTEAEFHRAAFGSADGEDRAFPWGDEEPWPTHGVFGFERWDPAAVGTHPAGDTPGGICELVGNGWEWTSTPFTRLPGAHAESRCHGFAANLADGKRFVIKGASPRTALPLLRRSFRNGLRPHDRFAYVSFRCVR